MKTLGIAAALMIAAAAGASGAVADPHKGKGGKGHGRAMHADGRGPEAFTQSYDDGFCRVERKVKKNGAYKEEVECRGERPSYAYPSYGYRY